MNFKNSLCFKCFNCLYYNFQSEKPKEERIRLYKELNEINTADELTGFEKKLTDRFGALPLPAKDLLEIVRIKWLAISLGIEKILMKNDLLIATFVSNQDSPFYSSALFASILSNISRNHKKMKVRQRESKLILTIMAVGTVEEAIKVLNSLSGG